MNFLSRLFKRSNDPVTCPRCLGKGHVDENDIKRLNKEMQWLPGSCAYCNGLKTVDAGMMNKVPVDLSYLTTERTATERRKLKSNDKEAMQRAIDFDTRIAEYVDQIVQLYFVENLEIEEIAEQLLHPNPFSSTQSSQYQQAKRNWMDYIAKVIAVKKRN
ncbi:MAG TPA: hypothetical protein VM187_08785 [Niastella sp.]|nr:hypothetical protein [Niastella sp.]